MNLLKNQLSVYDLKIVRRYFCGNRQQVGNDDDELPASFPAHLHKIAFHLVERAAMHPYSLAFGDVNLVFALVDFINLIEMNLLFRLFAYLDEIFHLFLRYGQIDKPVFGFPCDELEVVIIMVFEINNLPLAGVDKYQTMDDGYPANDFLAVDGAKDFLLGYEMLQAVLFIREKLFGHTLVLVGPHDIPLGLILTLSIFHTILTFVFYEKSILMVHPDVCIRLYISRILVFYYNIHLFSSFRVHFLQNPFFRHEMPERNV